MQSFYYISNLITVFLSLGLSLFIYLQGKKQTNILFALYSLCVAGWAGARFVSWINSVHFWMQLSIGFAVFIPVIYYHFFVVFTKKEDQFVKYFYFTSSILFIISFTPLMIKSIVVHNGFTSIVPGPFYLFFTFFFAFLILSGFIIIIKKIRTSENLIYINQLKYLLLASIIGFGGGSLVFTSTYLPNLAPIGYGFIPLYSLIAAYSIVKHRLLDINIVIRGGLVYSLLTVLITGTYFLGFILFRDIFAGLTEFNSVALNLGVVVIFLVLFQPLRSRVQNLVDKLFFKEKIDRENAIVGFSNQIMTILEQKELVDFVVSKIKEVLRIQWATIYVKDLKTGSFYNNELKSPEAFNLDFLKNNLEVIFLSSQELLFPIHLKGELLGVLQVKGKLSQEDYSLFEIDLLKVFLSQAAAALKNSFLLNEIVEHKAELFNSRNLATVGTLAAGMSHQIKNPLAVVKGLTQILPQNIDDKEFLDKFVRIVPGQIDRINETVEALLKVGKKPASQKTDVDLNELLLDVIDFVKISFKEQNVDIKYDFCKLDKIVGDYNMLYQAVFNLLQNAAQAMRGGGGLIMISTYYPAKIIISDNGKGITEKQIDKIFTPFITNKARGIGLGLFMVKKILEDHNATIRVESVDQKGSSFIIDFKNG